MVRVTAIRDALTRAGLVDGKMPEQTEDPWSELVAGGLVDDRNLPGGDAEVERSIEVANAVQIAVSASEEAWRDVHREDAEEVERNRIRPDERTVRGEVVGNATWSPLDARDASKHPTGASEYDTHPQGGSPSRSGRSAYEQRLVEDAEDEERRRDRDPRS